MEEKQDLQKIISKGNHGVDEEEYENETPEFSFTFKFPTFEEFSKTLNSNGEFVSHDDDPREDDFENQESVLEQMTVKCFNLKNVVEVEEKEEIYTFSEAKLQKKYNLSVYSSSHSNRDSIDTNDVHSPMSDVNVHPEDVFLPDENKVEEKGKIDAFSEEKLQKVHDESVYSSPDSDMFSICINDLHSPTFDLYLEDGFLSDEYIELDFCIKEETEQNNETQSNFLFENDFGTKSATGNEKKLSNDATNKLEHLLEHQEQIEQLKKEIKKAKTIRLPTILEESESSPKIMDGLKPLKIEEMYQKGGGKMGKIYKFYKSYKERMRKFDIFSCQKMYPIGFLQLKYPFESSSCSISSIPEITTLFTQSFTTNKGKKHENDPTMNFIQELQSDLEIVYVGQMCLSWEILHWQYEKALDIRKSDHHGLRKFNNIAGEFQQFQVLMQRFIEDEPFQGPRIQNYIKTRFVFRNLLQIPVIRDDHLKSNMASEYVHDITSDRLVEILEESINIFWRFVHADKYKRQTPIEFQSHEDLQLFMDLQKDLHKKERKLKEALRSENSILKKLRSCKEDETEDQMLYFFCQKVRSDQKRFQGVYPIVKFLLRCSRMYFPELQIRGNG
ncbi:hypothetical protein R6Q57_012028 [Mikania cordata]